MAFPEIVVVMSVAGTLEFNPLKDKLKDKDVNEFLLSPPTGNTLPQHEFKTSEGLYQAPPKDRTVVSVNISSESDRF